LQVGLFKAQLSEMNNENPRYQNVYNNVVRMTLDYVHKKYRRIMSD